MTRPGTEPAYCHAVVVRFGLVVVAVLAVGHRPAHALKPKAHAAITEASCLAVGLPRDFCRRAATENYNVDSREWDDMAAHAQIAAGETACDAAEHTVEYVRTRGEELHLALTKLSTGSFTEDDTAATGIALGRLLHSVQDQCAHRGMPNPQHAWFSLSDFCEGTELSPDTQDNALACAQRETDAIMARVAHVVREAGVATVLARGSCPEDPFHDRTDQQQPICDRRFLPGPIDACGFLGEAKEWDGVDRQWDGDSVGTALLDAFVAGLEGGRSTAPVCERDDSLAPAVSDPIVDVSGGTPSCTRIHLLCLGKADHADNPFETDETDEIEPSGCAVTGHDSAGTLLLLYLVLRRRRRSP